MTPSSNVRDLIHVLVGGTGRIRSVAVRIIRGAVGAEGTA
jgi:hypothetical protein